MTFDVAKLPRRALLDEAFPGQERRPDSKGWCKLRCTVPGCQHAHGDKTPALSVNVERGAWKCRVSGRAGRGWRELVTTWWGEERWRELLAGMRDEAPARAKGPKLTLTERWAELEPEVTWSSQLRLAPELVQRYLRSGTRYPGDPRSDTAIGIWDRDELVGLKFRLPPGAVWGVGKAKGLDEKYVFIAGSKAQVLLLAELIDERPDAAVLVCAGEKDALVAASHLDAGRWAPVTGCSGESSVPPGLDQLVRSRRVVIAYDGDKAGREGAWTLAEALKATASTVVAAVMPDGCDVADVWERLGTEGLEALLLKAGPVPASWKPEVDRDPRRVIEITTNLRDMVDTAEEVLAARRTFFCRGGELVHVVEVAGVPEVRALREANLEEELSATTRWRSRSKSGAKWKDVPQRVVKALHQRGQWRVPELFEVRRTPTLRPDGTVLSSPGYDRRTGVLMLLPPRARPPRVPEKPTTEQAERAWATLTRPLAEFTFRDGADRSTAVALMLTILARPAIDGPTPMWLIRASTPGTGKTLLAKLCTAVALGRAASITTWPKGRESSEEERKLLMATGREGWPAAIIDNVDRAIGSDVLAAAITSRTFRARLLSQNLTLEIPVPVLICTGNNVQVRGDMARRVVVVDLEAGVERPEGRAFSTPADRLLESVENDHGHLVEAGLTLLRWHLTRGSEMHLPEMGSFEAWSRLIRGCLVRLDAPDPICGTARVLEESDPEQEAREVALHELHEAFHGTPATAYEMAMRANARDSESLGAALAALSGSLRVGDIDPAKLGYVLRSLEGRIAGGLRLKKDGITNGRTRWVVQEVVKALRPAMAEGG